jgi:hypothetical protein
MNPVVRIVGKMLRLVGISSPEDSGPKLKEKGDPPSWRDAEAEKSEKRDA